MEVRMTGSPSPTWKHIGPEPWRVEPLRDYDGPAPVPLEAIREGLLHELGDLEGWTIAHGIHVGSFGGRQGWIPITYAEHPDHGRWQWFPIRPDAAESE